MSQNYYYLVSGLPDLIAGKGGKGFSYSTIMSEVYEELSDSDREQVKWLRFRYDNENLISLIEQRETFDIRGNYSKEELAEEKNLPETLPTYMVSFLDAYKDGKELYPGLGFSEQLFTLYYSELLASDSTFLRDWAELELNIQNFVVGKGSAHLNLDKSKSIIPLNETADRIVKSHTNDFGLSGHFDWVEEILSSFDNPVALEEAIDATYWKKADEFASLDTFSIEAILAFVIKVNSIERWLRLEESGGESRINTLIQDLKSAVNRAK